LLQFIHNIVVSLSQSTFCLVAIFKVESKELECVLTYYCMYVYVLDQTVPDILSLDRGRVLKAFLVRLQTSFRRRQYLALWQAKPYKMSQRVLHTRW